VVAASCYGYACNGLGLQSFSGLKRNGMELSTGKILEENLVPSAFHQTLGDEFIFQQDNNLKHYAKSMLELLTKKTVNVPELPSYSFDLNMLEKFDRAFEKKNGQMLHNPGVESS
jgi:hypothetical protein